MTVWKKQTVHFIKDGKQVLKGTKGAKRKTILSKRFYGTRSAASGKRKQVPLTEDRKTLETLLRRLQGDEDRKKALGITEVDEKRCQSISDVLGKYEEHLRHKGNTSEYVKTCSQRSWKLFKATKATTISELSEAAVLKSLNAWRNTSSISLGTMNHYIGLAKAFSKWLLRDRQLRDDPFLGLQKQNAKTDRRRVRRAFTEDELKRLVRDTQACTK